MPRLNFVRAHIRDGRNLMTGSLPTKREPNRITCQITDYNYNPEPIMNPNSNLVIQFKCNQATMAIDNRYDVEVVDGATNFQEGDSRVYIIKSYRQVEAHREPVYRDTHRAVNREVYREVDLDST
jgi:hypothetical protein